MHNTGVMTAELEGLMKSVEERRQAEGLTQAQVAAACAMTQGHYSKLAGGRDIGLRCARSLEAWLARPAGKGVRGDPLVDGTAQRLAASIRRDIGRLAAMVASGEAAPPAVRGTSRGGRT